MTKGGQQECLRVIDLDDLEAKARVLRQDVDAFHAETHNEDRGWPVDDLGTVCQAFEVADAALDLVAEVRRLRRVEDAARRVISAADDCDREAEREPASRSSAPVVRSINAMRKLRAALEPEPDGE